MQFLQMFSSQSLGEKESAVTLHIYDVSLAQVGTGKINEYLTAVGTGAFHAAVEIYGTEWSYGYSPDPSSGVFSCAPKGCSQHKYRESIQMGPATFSRKQAEQLIEQMKLEWRGPDYDILRRNCCTFSNDFCKRLGVGPIPDWVTNLAAAGATVTDGLIKLGGAANTARIIAAAKAGQIDAKYNISGPMSAKASDFLDATKGVNKEFRITKTVGAGFGQVVSLIEQGPEGVRVIAFACGAASFVMALCKAAVVFNDPKVQQLGLRTYVILLSYNLVFSVTTMIFEAKPEWIQMVQGLDKYQNLLIDYCVFLATAIGRGLFYSFQGTLWLTFAGPEPLGILIVGLSLVFFFLTILHVMMYFGIMPQSLVSKLRDGEIFSDASFQRAGFDLLHVPPPGQSTPRGPG